MIRSLKRLIFRPNFPSFPFIAFNSNVNCDNFYNDTSGFHGSKLVAGKTNLFKIRWFARRFRESIVLNLSSYQFSKMETTMDFESLCFLKSLIRERFITHLKVLATPSCIFLLSLVAGRKWNLIVKKWNRNKILILKNDKVALKNSSLAFSKLL